MYFDSPSRPQGRRDPAARPAMVILDGAWLGPDASRLVALAPEWVTDCRERFVQQVASHAWGSQDYWLGLTDYSGAFRGGLFRNIAMQRKADSLEIVHSAHPDFAEWLNALARPLDSATGTAGDYRCGPFTPDWTMVQYRQAFEAVQGYLHAGDCYQVNLAQRFRAPFTGSPLAAYLALQPRFAAPWSAYIDFGDRAVLSFSPEHFLTIDQGRMVTEPIKGTRRRDPDPDKDQALRLALRQSPKEQAENLMIVDLLRNDLGRYAETGSVRVPDLFRVETFSNVHHLVSTVTARLRPEVHPLEAFLGCSPGGSITGAPKRRAMEIIEELEVGPRGAYCGSVFCFDGQRLVSNILIRTAQIEAGTLTLWGGGGIVVDSDASAEYQESIVKVNHIVEALGAPSLLASANATLSS